LRVYRCSHYWMQYALDAFDSAPTVCSIMQPYAFFRRCTLQMNTKEEYKQAFQPYLVWFRIAIQYCNTPNNPFPYRIL
jgi:hypothetical protein